MNRFLRVTPEAVFGTYASASTAKRVYPLDAANNIKQLISARPQWNIKQPKLNVPWLRGSEVYTVGGSWSDRHYWENIEPITWLNRVNSGQTAPWTTDQRERDLASMSFEYGYDYFNRTIVRERYTGVKVNDWELSSTADPANPWLNFRYNLVGSKALPDPITGGSAPTNVEFPEPSFCGSTFTPLTFWQLVFTFDGAALDFFDRVSIRGQHTVTTHFDSKRYYNRIHIHGRTVTLSARIRLDASNDPRVRWLAQSALGTTKLVFTKPGVDADTLELSIRGNSRVDQVEEEHTADADGYTTFTATAMLDCGTGDDFAVTYTDAT